MAVDPQTRAANAQIILGVVEAKGGDGRFLRAIAGRESGLNHQIRHELPADRNGSVRAWERNRERLFASNPFIEDLSLWNHGKGLFGMMPANHVHRWDPNAHPDVLFDPYVASVVAARLTRRCMRSGAQTWADVDQCWATGSPKRTSSWPARRDRMIARLGKLGFPASLVDAVPEPGDWGTAPQDDQDEVLEDVEARLFGEEPEPPELIRPLPSPRPPAVEDAPILAAGAGRGSTVGLVAGLVGAASLLGLGGLALHRSGALQSPAS